MEKDQLLKLTDDELIVKNAELKKSKIYHALIIGFLAGVLIFGVVGWIMNPERKFGFFIPMLIPILFIRGILKGAKKNKDLEEVLKEKGLS